MWNAPDFGRPSPSTKTYFNSYQRIANGGPIPETIGNFNNREPFTGTIDEVAFYDFALSPDEVSDHYQRAMRGEPYFES